MGDVGDLAAPATDGASQGRDAAAPTGIFAALAVHLPVGVYAFRIAPSGELSFDYLSARVGEILGIDVEAAERDAQVAFSSIHPDDVDGLLASSVSAAVTRGSWEWEGRCLLAGETRYIRLASHIGGEDDGGTVWHGFAEDVTERRRADAALAKGDRDLRESRDLLSAVIAATVDAVYVKDPDGRYLLVNPAAEAMSGRPADAFLGKDDTAVFPAAEAAALMASDRAAMAADGPLTAEERITSSDGATHWLLSTKGPLRAPGGASMGMFGVSRDVTETRRALEAIRESEARYHSLVESMDAVVSMQEVGRGRTFLSRQAETLLGFPPDVLAAPGFWRSRVVAEDQERVYAVWEDSDDVDAYLLEYRMRRADDTVIWVEERERAVRLAADGAARWYGLTTDITERHRLRDLERSQAALEERLGQMVQRARDIVLLIDADGRVVEANGAAVAAYGYDLDSLRRLTVADLRAPAHRGAYEAQWAAAARPDGVLFESVHMRRDGSTFPVEVSSHVVAIGGVEYRQSIVRDISERVQATEAARNSEALAMAVIQGTADVIYVKDLRGRMLLVNEVAARIIGRDAHDLVGLDERSWFPPEQAAAIMAADAGVLDAGVPLTVEEAITDGDGNVRWYLNRKSPLFAADGSVIGLLAVAREITERRAMEEALRASESLQRSVFDTLTDGVLVYNGDGRIIAANPRASEVLGMSRESLASGGMDNARWVAINEDGSELGAEDYPASVTLRTGTAIRDSILELARPDGARVWLRLSTEALRDAQGGIAGVVASFSDISAQRDLESRLRQSQRLEAVGQLAGGVAHDFNNLLGAITGYIELVRDELAPNSAGHADIDEALLAADRAARLTRQLLAFSRRQVLRPVVVDPAAVIEQLVPLLGRLLGGHIELTTASPKDLGRIWVDPGQLEQVIVNLAVNARDAMPDGGRLAIVLADVPADDPETPPVGMAPGPRVRITVSDTGTGMDLATQARVFEPFFTTKDAGKGSGLGLATVYGIVGAYDGHISLSSAPGEGTTFTIDLPRVDGVAEAGLQGRDRLSPAQGSETILLVEDEPALRASTARTLRSLGYVVIDLDAAAPALVLSDAILGGVDLLIADVVMPGMSGVRLADELGARRPGLPTLLISGFAPEDAMAGRANHAGTAFLGKPFSRDALAAAVRAALDGPGVAGVATER